MRWFENHRMDWIAETLRVFRFINRSHLIRKFGISEPQASNDLRTFQGQHPKAMKYNVKTRRYEAAEPEDSNA